MPKIVNQLRKTVWQTDSRRVALIKARRAVENALMAHMASVNLDMAIDAFATAEDDALPAAECALTYATICEQLMRERNTCISTNMLCACGSNCNMCEQYNKALYTSL